MTGIERIAAERKRQIEQEGWTPAHDDRHRRGQLAGAGSAYAMAAAAILRTGGPGPLILTPPPFFTFGEEWWKPSADPLRDLEKSGALIAAEIDRILRERGSRGQ